MPHARYGRRVHTPPPAPPPSPQQPPYAGPAGPGGPAGPSGWEAPAGRLRLAIGASLATVVVALVVVLVVVAVAYDPDEPGWGFLGLMVVIAALPVTVALAWPGVLLVLQRRGVERARRGDVRMLRAVAVGALLMAVVSGWLVLTAQPLLLPVAAAPLAAGWYGVQVLRRLP